MQDTVRQTRVSKLRIILSLVLAPCGAAFTFLNIPDPHFVTHTELILSLVLGGIIFAVTAFFTINRALEFARNNLLLTVIFGVLSLYLSRALFIDRGIALKEPIVPNFWTYKIFWITFPAYWFLFLIVSHYLLQVVFALWKETPKLERQVTKWIFLAGIPVLVLVFTVFPFWYHGYDTFWSLDSGFLLKNMTKVDYYDIRHPLLGIFFYTLSKITHVFCVLLVPAQVEVLATAILFQIVNLAIMLLCALLVRAMTKSTTVWICYLSSIGFLIYILAVEKYQVIVLTMLIYLYQTLRGKNAAGWLAASILFMPTNIFLVSAEFIVKQSWRERLTRLGTLVVTGMGMVLASGRIEIVLHGLSQVNSARATFAAGDWGYHERFYSLMHFFQANFLAISGTLKDDGKYEWSGLSHFPSITAFVLVALIIIGLVVNFKNKFTQICAVWIAFAVALFIPLNWSPGQSPLFNIYFLWATAPAAAAGFLWVIKKLRLNRSIAVTAAAATMIFVNLIALLDTSLVITLG